MSILKLMFTKAHKKIYLWTFFYLLIGCYGIFQGAQTIVPGPTSIEYLTQNKGEAFSFAEGIPPKDTLNIFLHSDRYFVSDDAAISARESLYKLLSNNTSLFSSIRTLGHTMTADDLFFSKDKCGVLMIAVTKESIDKSPKILKEIPSLIQGWELKNKDFKVLYFSNGTMSNELFELINDDLDRSLLVSIPITACILLWAFRSVAATLLTLCITGINLICSLGVSALISKNIIPISATANQLVVLLVLAIGIDYALFFISRVRDEVSSGKSYENSILIAQSHTSVSIFWSGITVAISLVGLFFMNDTVLTSMAEVSIVSVLITVFGTLFALPKIMMIMKSKIEWGSFPLLISKDRQRNRWIKWSLDRPAKVASLCATFLLFMSYFSSYLTLGSTIDLSLFPKSMQTVRTFDYIKDQFPALSGVDFSIILQGENLESFESDGGLNSVFDSIASYSHIRGPIRIERSQNEKAARFLFIAEGTSNEKRNESFIEDLETKVLPKLKKDTKITSFLAGTLPFEIQQKINYSNRTPVVFAIVLALSFVLLLIAFRSIVIPIKAIILNLLSTSASFGLLVLLFQLGGWHYGIIEAFVPALLFSILFGLSMDYHVLLISRIQEEMQTQDSFKKALDNALRDTFGIITSAAMIMISVFLVIASLELPIMKQLGVGLAFAVFIDATIVRCALLPASMILLGKYNWYLPSWLRWIPKFKM